MLVALATGVMDGAARIRRHVEPLNWVPTRPRPRRWRWASYQARKPRSALDRVGEVVRLAGYRAAIGAVASARVAVDVLLMAGYRLRRLSCHALNWLHTFVIRLGRRIQQSLHSTWITVSTATALAVAFSARALWFMAGPLAAIAASAWLVTASAQQTQNYLTRGSLSALGEFSALDTLATLLLAAAWIQSTAQSVREGWKSAGRSATIGGPYALLLISAGGWLVGIPGTLGYGVIHVGWVTAASTIMLATAFLWTAHRQAEEPTAMGNPPEAPPVSTTGTSEA
jgi:hypothetical protein